MAMISQKSPNGSGHTGEDSEQLAVTHVTDRDFRVQWDRTRNTRPTCAGRVLPPHWRVWVNYALTSAPCGAWLGMSSSSSLVRRAWAKPKPTSTAMIPASANAAMAHQKAISAIRLKP